MATVAAGAPAGLAWGSSIPGAAMPFEWGSPSTITAARSLPVEWGETFRGSQAPLEWAASERNEGVQLPFETALRTKAAEFAAPTEIANRQTATADAAIPAEWADQARYDAPLAAAAQGGTAVALAAPTETKGSAVIAADHLLPFVVAAARAIAAPFPAELCGALSASLSPQIGALQSRDFGVALSLMELLGGERREKGAVSEILAGMRGSGTTGPEFLAALLLDPYLVGEFAAVPGLATAMRGEMLAALRRDALVPTDGTVGSGSSVAAKALLRFEWRQKKVRIRRLLASPGRRRVLGPAGPDSGR